MGDKTKIEWSEATWTPIRARNRATGKVGWHCQRVTPGCENCYSEGINKRLGTGLPFKPGHRKDVDIFLDDAMLTQPLRWKRPRMIFVCSMTDLFGDFVTDEMIDRVFAVMALAPQHTFQVLSKRAGRMRDYCSDPALPGRLGGAATEILTRGRISQDRAIELNHSIGRWPLPHCWLGVSAEDQTRADERVPDLLATPAAVRFISAEPLLGPILLSHDWLPTRMPVEQPGVHRTEWPSRPVSLFGPTLDWIIVGSESGSRARPCNIEWVRSIRDQCSAAGTALFWKQHAERGHKIPTPELDGRKWMDFPQITV